jgi:hypothetical protein
LPPPRTAPSRKTSLSRKGAQPRPLSLPLHLLNLYLRHSYRVQASSE